MISYAMQGLSFILLRQKLPHIARPYRSPLGVPAPRLTVVIALVTLYFQLQDPVYRTACMARRSGTRSGLLYFALIGRHAAGAVARGGVRADQGRARPSGDGRLRHDEALTPWRHRQRSSTRMAAQSSRALVRRAAGVTARQGRRRSTSTASCAASTCRARSSSRARQGLRLLRRGAGLGLERPALRQRAVHRLAHGLSGRAGAHPAGHLPRRAVRRRHAVLPRRVPPTRRKPSVRAACCGGCSSAAARHGLRGLRRLRVRILRVRRDARVGAREALPRPASR